MQEDEIVKMIATETPILFSKAVEVFMVDLVTRAYEQTRKGNRTTIVSADVKAAVENCDWLEFLGDMITPTEGYVYDMQPIPPHMLMPPVGLYNQQHLNQQQQPVFIPNQLQVQQQQQQIPQIQSNPQQQVPRSLAPVSLDNPLSVPLSHLLPVPITKNVA